MIALQHNIPVGVEIINKGTEIDVSSRDVVSFVFFVLAPSKVSSPIIIFLFPVLFLLFFFWFALWFGWPFGFLP